MKSNKPEDLFRAEKERSLTVRNSLHARLLAEAKAAFDKLMAEGQAARKSGRPRKHPLPPLKTSSSVRPPLKPPTPPPMLAPVKPALVQPVTVKATPVKPAARTVAPAKSGRPATKRVAKASAKPSAKRAAKKTQKGGASKSKSKRPSKR